MRIKSNTSSITTQIALDTSEERKLFEQDILRTRLCYTESYVDNADLKITNASKYSINLSNRIFTFPYSWALPKRDSYYLRFAFDMNSIQNGLFPLHGAALTYENRGLIILGGSKAGKSLTLNKILETVDASAIGDDHIIYRDGVLRGNDLIGFRGDESDEKTYRECPSRPINITSYSIALVDVRKNRSIKAVLGKINEKFLRLEVLKYFMAEPLDGGFRKVINQPDIKNLRTKYWKQFDIFVNNADKVICANGDPSYVAENVMEVLLK